MMQRTLTHAQASTSSQQKRQCGAPATARRCSAARAPLIIESSSRPCSGRATAARRRQALRVECFVQSAQSATATSTSTPTRVSPAAATDALLSATKHKLCVSWAGAGIYTFWEMGAIKFLAERFDMTKVKMVGASGGAIAAVLAACGVSADRALDYAYEMSLQHNIWERPLALVGTWGSLIEQWLDDLLPANAHELCQGRVTVVVTTLPDCGQVGVSDFTSKQDLISAIMASSHIPFALDLKLTRTFRGRQCVDGSFPDFFHGLNCELLRLGPEREAPAVIFDYTFDAALQRKGRMDMLEVKSYEEIRKMFGLGYEYAARLHSDGRFDHYELSELLLQGDHGHMSEVLVPEHSNATTTTQQQQQQQQLVPALASSSSSSSVAAASQQLSSAPRSSPMGLVLELQQDERELVAELRHTQQHQQQLKQGRQWSPA